MGDRDGGNVILLFRKSVPWESFFPYTMGTVTNDGVDTQEEEEEIEIGKLDDFGSQLSLKSSTHENEPSTNMENNHNTVEGKHCSREFMTTTDSDVRSGTTRLTEPESKSFKIRL